MDVVNIHAGAVPPDPSAARRPVNPAQPVDGPMGRDAPQPQSRGEAVVFGGSLANMDPGSRSRDSVRQSKLERREAEQEQSAERRAEADARRAEREAGRRVDVSA
ncbi:MAG: hypothetical protein ACK4YQ_04760 [Phenylobacterium sp.]|uniref:hypothetical protein n=1 Tax=Phenylobacterium sp. TaxID=1871053 RepID=UPI00391A0859